MIKKRLIFTLLFDNGHFVLSRNFSLQRVGDIKWLLDNYNFEKISNFIDELIILNIRDKKKNLNLFCETIKELSTKIFIPIAAGGGIKNSEDALKVMRSGADKIVCNTLLNSSPSKLIQLKKIVGQQSIVGSLDVKEINNNLHVFNNELMTISEKLSDFLKNKIITDYVGEIYLNSIDRDGTGNGYLIKMVNEIEKYSTSPIIIAGGAGNWKHLLEGLQNKNVNAVATANLLNFVGDGLKNARMNIIKEFDLPHW